MDKSVDSIGSCSLDVDAESSDKSDTSGSLNFPTPISIKDITRDFVTNINERCAVRKVETTATLLNTKTSLKVNTTISTQPSCNLALPSALNSIATETGDDKKPSYLNLACCVNGYSNITTYDSKIRQDINKSREVSPIRPSTSSLQYCKKNDLLAPPPPILQPISKMNSSELDVKHNSAVNMKSGYGYENGHHNVVADDEQGEVKNTSFIQQQMERLYGPAALAQVFYSPKKVRTINMPHIDDAATSELKLKFKELSPRKDYGEFRRKINGTGPQPIQYTVLPEEERHVESNNIDLPVLRHLSPEFKKNFEFRAQPSKMSPKRNLLRNSSTESKYNANVNEYHDRNQNNGDEVDHKIISIAEMQNLSLEDKITKSEFEISKTVTKTNSKLISDMQIKMNDKDGNYFLKLFKSERERLLSLVSEAEAQIKILSNNADVDEDILGKLRTASGKAELLVTSKMKQFEGLCQKNLNNSPEDQFPTTADDLQGFWDMVNLQIDECNSKFAEIDKLKANNWKKQDEFNSLKSPKKQQKSNKSVTALKSNKTHVNGSSKTPAQSSAALERESKRKEFLKKMRQKNVSMASAAIGLENQLNVAKQGSEEISVNENNS